MIRKQRKTIDTLTADNKELVRVLSVNQALPKDVESRLRSDWVVMAEKEGRDFVGRIHELEASLKQLTEEEEVLRSRSSILSRACDASQKENQVNTMERRLNHEIVKFNDLIATNTSLRTDVDTLRQEKARFVELERVAQVDIEKFKGKISDLIDGINANYAAKDKYISDLEHLRTMADREHFEFEREWKELNSLLDNDQRLYQTVLRREMSATAPLTAPVSQTQPDAHPATDEDSELLKLRTDVAQMESLFQRMKESVGIANLTDLMDSFARKETSNYSMFNHLNIVATDIERVMVCIDSTRADMRGVVCDKDSANKQLQITTNQDIVDTSIEQNKRIAAAVSAKTRLIHRIAYGLQLIYELFNGQTVFESVSRTSLMEDSDLSEDNITKFLGNIESKLTPLLPITTAVIQKKATPLKHIGKNKRSSIRSYGGTHALPSSIIATDDVDDATRPLTRSELEARLTRCSTEQYQQEQKIRGRAQSASTRPGTSSTNHGLSRKKII